MSFWIYKGKIFEREAFRLVPGFPALVFLPSNSFSPQLIFPKGKSYVTSMVPNCSSDKVQKPLLLQTPLWSNLPLPHCSPLKFSIVHTSFLTRPHILWPLGFCTCCSLPRVFLPPPLFGSLLLTLHEYLPKFDLVPCASPSQHSSL